jgi:hypothetical protein
MKHIEIDYHFVRDKVVKKLLEVRFISSSCIWLHQCLAVKKITRFLAQSQLNKVVIEEGY